MRKILLFTSFVAALCAAPLSARAQDLGKQGDLSVAAERLSGLSTGTISVDPDGPVGEADLDYLSFRLLTSDAVGSGPVATLVPVFSFPRIGIDYFLAEQISLGGSLGLVSTSSDDDGGNSDNATAFLLALRVGYWLPLNDTFSLWPRGGLTFMSVSQSDEDDDDEISTTLPALTLEAPLMIAMGPAFLQLAATLDLSFAGSAETREDGETVNEFDVSAFELGLQAGLGIVF
jgi:hypothetical protein